MKFSDIPGHDDVKERLRLIADSDKIPHAILISGPAGSGKLPMARAFAQYIHCTNRHDGDSCGRCPSCLQHQSFNNADMYFVFPVVNKNIGKLSDDHIDQWREFLSTGKYGSYNKWLEVLDAGNSQPTIYADEANEIIRKMNLSNFSAKYKIMLIWLPEKMQEAAANKLLKLIEEPWGDTKFILVSNDSKEILPTIFSRTQRVNMHRLGAEQIAEALCAEAGADPAMALRVARVCEGDINAAFRAMEVGDESGAFRDYFQSIMRKAYMKDVRGLKDDADEIAGLGREKIRRFLAYFARMVRENFLYNLKNPALNALSEEEEKFSRNFAPFINERNVEAISAEVTEASYDIARNANPKMVLFDTLLKLIIYIRK